MGKGKKAAPQADRLVQLCEGEKVELFHDQYSTAFAHFSMPCDTAISCDKNDVRNLLSVSNTKISSPTHGEPSLTKLGKEEKYVKEPDKRLQQPQKPQVTAISQSVSQVKNVTCPLSSNKFKAWLALLMWKQRRKNAK